MRPSSPIARAGWYVTIAWEFVATIAAGSIIGWFFDRWLGTAPCLVVVATLAGVVGGFVRFVQRLRRLDRDPGP